MVTVNGLCSRRDVALAFGCKTRQTRDVDCRVAMCVDRQRRHRLCGKSLLK